MYGLYVSTDSAGYTTFEGKKWGSGGEEKGEKEVIRWSEGCPTLEKDKSCIDERSSFVRDRDKAGRRISRENWVRRESKSISEEIEFQEETVGKREGKRKKEGGFRK